MDDDRDMQIGKGMHGFLEYGGIIAAPYIADACGMYGLKTELYPYELAGKSSLHLGKEFEHLGAEAVRPGRNGKTYDVFGREGFGIDGTQLFHGAVSIGIGLKIGNEMTSAVFAADEITACGYLFADGGTIRRQQ